MQFGNRLKQLRLSKKLTQEEVANIINVHRATVGKYETEERFPDKETLHKLADFFNVSVDYLLGRTDNPNPYKDDAHSPIKTSAYHALGELDEEDIEKVEEYIELLKLKKKK